MNMMVASSPIPIDGGSLLQFSQRRVVLVLDHPHPPGERWSMVVRSAQRSVSVPIKIVKCAKQGSTYAVEAEILTLPKDARLTIEALIRGTATAQNSEGSDSELEQD